MMISLSRLLLLTVLAVSSQTPGDPDPGKQALEEGDRLLEAGYPVLAIRQYNEALKVGVPATTVHLRVAYAECAAGNYEAAEQLVSKVLLAEPEHYEAMRLGARVRFWLGRYDTSWKWFRDYLAAVPADDAARMDYALSLAWGRRFDDALQELLKLEKTETFRVEARFRRAEVLAWKEQYEEARKLVADLLGRKEIPVTLESRCHVLLGKILAWEEHFTQADGEYRTALELNPQNEEAWLAMGELQEWQGKIEEAKVSYAKAVQVAPKSKRAREALERLGRA
ncbi:MAG: tetratricopeptide repeat protein [Planctomycetota bacterium]